MESRPQRIRPAGPAPAPAARSGPAGRDPHPHPPTPREAADPELAAAPQGLRRGSSPPGCRGARAGKRPSIGHRIAAARAEGMAAGQAPQGEPAPSPGTMATDRLGAIGTAAGNEAAVGPKQGRDPAPVGPDQGQQHGGQSTVHEGRLALHGKGQGWADPAWRARSRLRSCFKVVDWCVKATGRIGVVPGRAAAKARPGRLSARSRPPELNPSCPDTAALA